MSEFNTSPSVQAMQRAVRAKAVEDPLVPLTMTAREVIDYTMIRLKDDRGVHLETALALFGALAGHLCAEIGVQARRDLGAGFNPHDLETFCEVQTKSGSRYVLGKLVDDWMFHQAKGFWPCLAAFAKQHGAAMPDQEDLRKHVIESFDKPEFGIPRLPDKHQPAVPPVVLLRQLGSEYVPRLTMYLDAVTSLAFAAQSLMTDAMAADVIPLETMLKILAESAVPMARQHPDDLGA